MHTISKISTASHAHKNDNQLTPPSAPPPPPPHTAPHPTMEERLPPPAGPKAHPPIPLPLPLATATADLETYVVQVPRDQIYRVPPPEHACVIERYNNRAATGSSNTCRRTLCWAAAVPATLILASVIAVVALRHTLYSPKPPEFSVAGIQAKNLGGPSKARSRPDFNVSLRADNPNPRLSVSYQGGSGEASLAFKKHKIGLGKIRTTVDQDPGGGAVDFPVVLVGSAAALPPEIEKGLADGSSEKRMTLTVEVAMEMRSWVRNERKNIKISCDFRVKNSLSRMAKISYQLCRTEF